ncbi:hypothetical protein WJX84_000044 [Apatococcus fuscideae]|uniref:Uncharacterized protein n=1 Tax=Apatococcus fuscideae TaxID=2026836 RepID=A0AAW1RUR0_9CHLO
MYQERRCHAGCGRAAWVTRPNIFQGSVFRWTPGSDCDLSIRVNCSTAPGPAVEHQPDEIAAIQNRKTSRGGLRSIESSRTAVQHRVAADLL